MNRASKAIGILLTCTLLVHGYLLAAEPALVRVLFATPGQVTYLQGGQQIVLHNQDSIPPGGEVRAEAGTAVLRLDNGTIIQVRPGSGLLLMPPGAGRTLPDKVITGSGRVLYQTNNDTATETITVEAGNMQIRTANAVFAASTDANQDARLGVHNGGVQVQNEQGDQLQAERGDGVLALAQATSLQKVRLPETPVARAPRGEQGQRFLVQWSSVQALRRYRVQVARDERMADLVFSGIVSDRQELAFDMFVPGSYYWTVESIDGLGFASIPSQVVAFTVAARD